VAKWKGRNICGQVVLKFLLNLTHPLDQIFGVFRQAHRSWGGDQALSAAHEQLSVELVGEVVQLKTDRARREEGLLRGASHARRLHHGKEQVRAGEYP